MIEILMVHSSDYGTEIRVFKDGEDITHERGECYIVMVDAGAGWTYEEWQNSAQAAFEGGRWPQFCNAVFDAYRDPPSREYIEGWPEEDM